MLDIMVGVQDQTRDDAVSAVAPENLPTNQPDYADMPEGMQLAESSLGVIP